MRRSFQSLRLITMNNIIKSPTDSSRSYRGIQLANKLKAVRCRGAAVANSSQ
jgi:hypothetical protein